MNHIGTKTPQPTFLTVEVHKLQKEFVCAVAVKNGQPVKLANDGEVTPLGAGDSAHLCIGNVIADKPIDGLVTVMMKGHAELTVIAGAIQNAGPVKWSSYDSSIGRNVYVVATDAATTQGYALEPATAANQEITVVIH